MDTEKKTISTLGIKILGGLISVFSGSTLIAWFAKNYGILDKTSFTIEQELLFLLVWGLCLVGVASIVSYLLTYCKRSKNGK